MRACLVLALLAACAAKPPSEDLLDEVRHFHDGVRWRRYEDAAARLPPGEREDFLDRRDALDKELFIDDYEIARVKMKKGKESALVDVKYTWHLDSVGVVYDTVVQQVWELHGKAWLRMTETLKHGEPMPGVDVDVGERPEGEQNARRSKPL